jgi:3-oxoacyl-[acyl-carrier-protein] synthase II
VTACTTGALAVIRGAQMIADGDAEIVICGGADASLHPLWLAAFRQMGVLAEPHPELGPAWACQPFDRTRGGFAVGEGAAVLVLESAESARRRGAEPLARIAGYASGTDPAGLTQLSEDGEPLAHVIRLACARAGCEPSGLAYIQAHGTGTASNDRVEVNALRRAIGPALEEIPLASIKGAIGHLLGGAGAVELALAVLACRDRRMPGNATLLEPDPALGRLRLPVHSVDLPPGPILKTSLGFGGHLAAVVVAPP